MKSRLAIVGTQLPMFPSSANDSLPSVGHRPIPLSAPEHRFAKALRLARIVPKAKTPALHRLATKHTVAAIKAAIGGPVRVA